MRNPPPEDYAAYAGHVECMRGQRFDLPDPIQTDDGWSIIVDEFGTESVWLPAAFLPAFRGHVGIAG